MFFGFFFWNQMSGKKVQQSKKVIMEILNFIFDEFCDTWIFYIKFQES